MSYGGGMGNGGGMGYRGGMGNGRMGYGGMSRMNNPNEQGTVLDQCFFIVEKLNYQMFHFCEMTRMIQAQSASLAYFLEIMKKVYTWSKNFISTNTKFF